MALTIRERSGMGSGTLARPIELAIDLSRVEPAPILRRFVLGYEGQAPTAVYGFTAPRRLALQVSRRSSDQLVRHVEVALLDGATRQRSAALVERADGVGTALVLPAGRYLIVASLLLAEQVEVELEVRATPVKTPLKGTVFGGGNGSGRLVDRSRTSWAIALGAGPSLAAGSGSSGTASGGGIGSGVLRDTPIAQISGRLVGSSSGGGSATAETAPFHWIDGRGRITGPLITINPANWDRSPVRTFGDGLVLVLKDGSGNALDLAGLEAALEVWDQQRLRLYGSYAVVIDAPAGRLDLSLSAEQIAALPPQACWDLRLAESGSGRTVYLLQGGFSPLSRYTETPD